MNSELPQQNQFNPLVKGMNLACLIILHIFLNDFIIGHIARC